MEYLGKLPLPPDEHSFKPIQTKVLSPKLEMVTPEKSDPKPEKKEVPDNVVRIAEYIWTLWNKPTVKVKAVAQSTSFLVAMSAIAGAVAGGTLIAIVALKMTPRPAVIPPPVKVVKTQAIPSATQVVHPVSKIVPQKHPTSKTHTSKHSKKHKPWLSK